MMIKRKLGLGVLLVTLSTTTFAGTEVFGYGETVREAQVMVLETAERSAKSKGTCVGSITSCTKEHGLFKCGAMVANHPGSCNKDGSDLAKIKKSLGL